MNLIISPQKKSEKKQEEKPKTVAQRSSVFMFEQQTEYMPMPIEKLYEKAKHAKGLIELCYILHDKDRKKDGTLKSPHYHMSMYFDRRKTVESVAKMLESKPQQIEIMTQQGQSAIDAKNNAFAYLCHRTQNAKKEGKYQYSPNEVTANFDYPKWLTEQESKLNSANDILELLNERHITKNQAIERIKTEFGGVSYAKNASKIESIAYANSLIDYEKWKKDMKAKNQPITVLWYYGESGSGKTRKAREECEKRNIHYYITSGSNAPFDGLIGLTADEQEVLIVDELRPNVVRYADLLQILDPFNYEVVAPARYHNPCLMAKVIIITSPYSPYDFYRQSTVDDIDNFEQLDRRISQTMKFTKQTIETVTSQVKIKNGYTQYVYPTIYTVQNPFYVSVEQRYNNALITVDEPFENIFGKKKASFSDNEKSDNDENLPF